MNKNIRVLMSLFVEDAEFGKIELNANYDKDKKKLKSLNIETFKEAVAYVMTSCPEFSVTANQLKLSLGLTHEFKSKFPDIYQGLFDFKKIVETSPIKKKIADEWIYRLIEESAKSSFYFVNVTGAIPDIISVPHLSFDSFIPNNPKQRPSSLKITIINVEE